MKINARFIRTKLHPFALGLALGSVGLATSASAQTNAMAPGPAASAQANAAPPGPEVTGRHKTENFFKRFDDANMEALGTPAYTPPPPVGAVGARQNRAAAPTRGVRQRFSLPKANANGGNFVKRH